MSNEPNPNELPPPNEPSEPIPGPTPIPEEEGLGLFARITEVTALSVGGLLTFAVLVTPARAKGASCSSKLKWEQRKNEIAQTIAASASDSAPVPAASAPTAAETSVSSSSAGTPKATPEQP